MYMENLLGFGLMDFCEGHGFELRGSWVQGFLPVHIAVIPFLVILLFAVIILVFFIQKEKTPSF